MWNQEINNTIAALENGGVIIYPTDTIWGLGCDILAKGAIEKIQKIKNRPEEKPFILLVDTLDLLSQYVEEIPERALFWMQTISTPLTIVYPKAKNVLPELIHADKSIAIRVCQHDFCKALIHKMGRPLLSTSVNISGEKPAEQLADIPFSIIEKTDYLVKNIATGANQASKIIKIALDGTETWIRP